VGEEMSTYPHHCAPEDVSALVERLKALEDPEQTPFPSFEDTDWRTLAGVCARVIKYLDNDLRKIKGTANCGTADSFLALSDDDKRKWFALSIRESTARKKAENALEDLLAMSLFDQGPRP